MIESFPRLEIMFATPTYLASMVGIKHGYMWSSDMIHASNINSVIKTKLLLLGLQDAKAQDQEWQPVKPQ